MARQGSKREITRRDISLNSTSRAPMQNINTAPTQMMSEMNLVNTAGAVEKRAGSSLKKKSNWVKGKK